MFTREVDVDESDFGVKVNGRGAAGKVAVFGLLKRNGSVFTVTVPNTQTAVLLPILRKQVNLTAYVYMDCYRRYDVL
ncbi:hypothetical protein C7N83_06745 [Neisseria iguanae]|uniref:Uncharacterized protein n=1 Tax=Neisseria iguanae TaxID=90242 RepID=A0A2P7U0D5_9NEIS|nr:hypothetical protein C7N83_06745 [Neisseria iguanae]